MIRLRQFALGKNSNKQCHALLGPSHQKAHIIDPYNNGDAKLGHSVMLIYARLFHLTSFFSFCNWLIFYGELFLGYIKMPCSFWNLHKINHICEGCQMAILYLHDPLYIFLVGILQQGQVFPFHLFISLQGLMNSHFIQWVVIFHYHIFKAKLSLIWPVGAPCPFEMSTYSLSISLFYSIRRYFRPILHLPSPSPWNQLLVISSRTLASFSTG